MKKILYTILILITALPAVSLAQVQIPTGGTGRNFWPVGSYLVGNGINPASATTSPTVGYITATTTSTSTFSGGIRSTCFSTNGTNCITGSGGASLSGTGIVTNIGSTQSTLSTSSLPVNVKDYGATGNGTTDDTSAIQTAINIATSTKRNLYIPSGIYKANNLILASSTSTTGSEGLIVYGDGMYGNTQIYVSNSATGASGFKLLGPVNGITIKDLYIYGTSATSSDPISAAIYVRGEGGSVDGMNIDNVAVGGMSGVYGTAFSNSKIRLYATASAGCSFGVWLARSSNGEANNSNLINGGAVTNCTVGWHLSQGIGTSIIAADAGGPLMETVLLMDGAHDVSVAESNWEVHSTGSTTIENLSTSTSLYIKNTKISNFGTNNGKYSVIKGNNTLILDNVLLGYTSPTHGGQIYEYQTINNETIARNTTAVVETYSYLGKTWYGNYNATIFPTETQPSGLNPSSATVGKFLYRVGSTSVSSLKFGVQDGASTPAYAWADLLDFYNLNKAGKTATTTVAPTYGQVLVGNNNNGYTLTATSSLGLSAGTGSGTVNSGTATNIAYYDTTDTVVSGTSTISITSAGNVGVGVATPSSKLHVQSNSSTVGSSIYLTNGAYGGGSTAEGIALPLSTNQFGFGNSNGDTAIIAKAGGTLNFLTSITGLSQSSRMKIDTLGRICIGDTNCTTTSMLQIASTTASNILTVNGASNNLFSVLGNGNVYVGTSTNTMWGADNPRLNIQGTTSIAGYLEVGIPRQSDSSWTPNYVADITSDIPGYAGTTFTNLNTGSTASVDLLFNNRNTAQSIFSYVADIGYNGSGNTDPLYTGLGGANSFYMYNTDGQFAQAVATTSSSGFFNWLTGGYLTANEKMRLTNAGNLGIGTTSPFTKLAVTGTITANNINATSTTATNTFSGDVVFGRPVKLMGYTVSGLPTCNSSSIGFFAYVTDAAVTTIHTPVTGGGSDVEPVFCNGTSWVVE